MRLRRFRVRGFRCIRDSGEVAVRDLAVLIGKNEGGKTAILQALSHLNKDSSFSPVDLCDEMYEDLHSGARVVEGEFELTDPEYALIREACPSCPEFRRVIIFRAIDHDHAGYEFPDVPDFGSRVAIDPDASASFSSALSEARELFEEIEVTEKGEDAPIPSPLEEALSALEKSEKPAPGEILIKLTTLRSAVPAHWQEKPDTRAMLDRLDDLASKIHSEIQIRDDVAEIIASKLHPKFVYFSEYKQIVGQINLPKFIAGVNEYEIESKQADSKTTIENLFFLGGFDAKHLEAIKARPDERVKYLAECGSRLTRALEPTWLTQKIEVEFEYSEYVLVIKVSDLHPDGTRTNKGLLRRRSEGFRWHFSFFVNFSAEVQRAALREAILLLDEPGLHLHPAQQIGMLGVLKQLVGSNQVIYTTHSPFMILDYSVGSLLSVELDEATHLSRIQPAYWKGDAETSLLVLHALGGRTLAEAWTQSLAAVSAPALIVEGPSDYMYLKVMMEVVRIHRNKSQIELPFNAELVPANGSSAIGPLAMFHAEKFFNCFALYGNEPQARKYSEALVAEGFDQGRVFFSEVQGKTESDIEDFFSDTEYLTAVNEVYAEILRSARFIPIKKNDLDALREKNKGVTRIVPLLDLLWKQQSGWGSFDKIKVCKRLCEHAIATPSFISERTIERFEALFNSISALAAPPEIQVDVEVDAALPAEDMVQPAAHKSKS
jgi:hypothetical protein